MDFSNAIATVKAAFEENECGYSHEMLQDEDGNDYCCFQLPFENLTYIVLVFDDVCKLTVKFNDLPNCPQNYIYEVSKLIAEFNCHSLFFTWRLDADDGVISITYSFIFADTADEKNRFMDWFNLGLDDERQKQASRIKSLFESPREKNAPNTIRIKI